MKTAFAHGERASGGAADSEGDGAEMGGGVALVIGHLVVIRPSGLEMRTRIKKVKMRVSP